MLCSHQSICLSSSYRNLTVKEQLTMSMMSAMVRMKIAAMAQVLRAQRV